MAIVSTVLALFYGGLLNIFTRPRRPPPADDAKEEVEKSQEKSLQEDDTEDEQHSGSELEERPGKARGSR